MFKCCLSVPQEKAAETTETSQNVYSSNETASDTNLEFKAEDKEVDLLVNQYRLTKVLGEGSQAVVASKKWRVKIRLM